MQMKASEIVSRFNKAEDKPRQVQILAELNACDKETILEVLRQNGISMEECQPKKQPKKNSKKVSAEKDNGSEVINSGIDKEPNLSEEQREQMDRVLAIPFPVIQACRDRVDFLTSKIAEMEKERDVLCDFMDGKVRNE